MVYEKNVDQKSDIIVHKLSDRVLNLHFSPVVSIMISRLSKKMPDLKLAGF